MAYTAITRAQLRARLIDMIEGTPFWSTDELNRGINEALRTWNMLVGRWHGRVTLITTPNTHDYSLSTAILYRTRVLHNGRPLTPTSYTSLAAAHPHWPLDTTASGSGIPTRPTVWCPISLRTFLIWPADALAWNSLTVDGVAETPQLLAEGAYVNLAEADVSVLLPYVLHLLSFKKGGAAFAETAPFYIKFLQAAAEENQLLTTSQAYRKWAGLVGRDEKPLRDRSLPSGVQLRQDQSQSPQESR